MENVGYLVLINNSYVGEQKLIFDDRPQAYRRFAHWSMMPGTITLSLNRVSKGGTVVDELEYYENPESPIQ